VRSDHLRDCGEHTTTVWVWDIKHNEQVQWYLFELLERCRDWWQWS